MNVTNDQVPLVEKSHELELAEVAIHDIHFIMRTDSPAYSRQWKIAQPYCRAWSLTVIHAGCMLGKKKPFPSFSFWSRG
jgi:hypothetical protein